ncbi:hypothetical protein V5O48_008895 [Marasmius crinis-equi]|uniref:Transmembrane protein n=1 Tax=Marasmius crinis-equi TaxID=585013 RepID=A0ABR3FCS4_9AGAR
MAAALYLHNALYRSDSTESPSRLRSHSRTLSSGTLRTVETQNSQPTEPLLQTDRCSTTSGHQGLLNRQSLHSNGTGGDWDMTDISLDGDPTSATREKRGYWEQHVRRRLRIWQGLRRALEVVLGVWAIYNTIRYFIAYTLYSSMDGQVFALALGCTTAVSFAFFVCDGVVAAFQSRLVATRIPIRSLLNLRTIFLYLASFFLLSPSVVNLVVTIVWRHSPATELSADHRCSLDIDVIWSTPPSKATCQSDSSNWTAWIALAIFRVAFTAVLVLSLLITTSQYNITRRPSQYTYRPQRRRRRIKEEPSRESATLVDSTTAPSTPATSTPQPSSNTPAFPRPPLRYASRSNSNSRLHDRRSLRSMGSSVHGDAQCLPSDSQHERCDTLPDEEACIDPDLALTRFDPAMQQRITDAIYLSPSAASTLPDPFAIRDDRELTNFVDRFRMLVSQITRETEDALEFARSDTYVTEREVESDDEDSSDEGYPQWYNPNYPPPPPPALGYDEFGRPYPPEDHVRILNQFVRRMPTIESLGSRELASIHSSSMGRADDERIASMSMYTLSRPPTRTMMSDFTGSEPPSRPGSVALSLNMTALVGAGGSSHPSPQTPKTPNFQIAAEAGEVDADRDGPVHQTESPLDGEFGMRLRGGNGSGPQLSHSRSSFSFHTANSGGPETPGTQGSPNSEVFATPSSSSPKEEDKPVG